LTEQAISPAPIAALLRVSTSQDHLSATLFLAALLHGVVIMGITFTGEESSRSSDDATSLEVVIVSSAYEDQLPPTDANLLAERNLTGAGNTSEDAPVRIAYGRASSPALPGPEQTGADSYQPPQKARTGKTLDVSAASEKGTQVVLLDSDTVEAIPDPARGLPGRNNPVEIVAEPDTETVLKSPQTRELVISANTRESRIASYLKGWKEKIERVGTVNFPHQVLPESIDRYPVLEVAVRADGSLEEVIVLKSSGERSLDQAAVNILRLSAPFDPFPDFLRSDYDVLRFSYEWRFGSGTVRTRIRTNN
jgi:protein TonB